MLRIGIVGLGAVSNIHIDAIKKSETGILVAVCDIEPKKREKAPNVNFYTDLKEMLQKEKLDVLHVCLPHHKHKESALLANRYGVHVFIEKPAGINREDIATIVDTRVKVGVCLQNRYNATTQKLMEIIKDNQFGALKGCRALIAWARDENYYSKDPWRARVNEAGGGVLLSQAIHTIDLLYLIGGNVSWVKGLAGNLLLEDIEVEDTACAYIRFENGTSATFYGTVTHCNNSSVEIEVVFEDAVLKMSDGRLMLGDEVLAEDRNLAGEKAYYGASHDIATKEFYDAILNDSQNYIPIYEAAESVLICEAVIESSKKGERVYL